MEIIGEQLSIVLVQLCSINRSYLLHFQQEEPLLNYTTVYLGYWLENIQCMIPCLFHLIQTLYVVFLIIYLSISLSILLACLSWRLKWAFLVEICTLSVIFVNFFQFLSFSILIPLGQFQSKLAKSILGWWGFKFAQMLPRGDDIEIMKIIP